MLALSEGRYCPDVIKLPKPSVSERTGIYLREAAGDMLGAGGHTSGKDRARIRGHETARAEDRAYDSYIDDIMSKWKTEFIYRRDHGRTDIS
jgi:hypothetical protein